MEIRKHEKLNTVIGSVGRQSYASKKGVLRHKSNNHFYPTAHKHSCRRHLTLTPCDSPPFGAY